MISIPFMPSIQTNPGFLCRLTNKRKPDELQLDQRHNRQRHPQRRLRVQRQPEEPLVRRVHEFPARLVRLRRALEYPVRVARLRVDFVPPSEAYETSPRDVLEVVEVGGEEEHGDDEVEHEGAAEDDAAEEVDEEGGWLCAVRVRIVSCSSPLSVALYAYLL